MAHAGIQGNVVRQETLGHLRLTESLYPAGAAIGTHSHSCAIFGLILRGYFQQQSSLVTLTCPSGSVFYNPPEIPHTNVVNNLGARCVYLEISPDWFRRLAMLDAMPGDPMMCPNNRVRAVARRIYSEWLSRDDLTPVMMEGLSCELVAEVSRSQKETRAGRPPVWLSRVRDLLQARFSDPPTLADLSVEAGVHQVHVARQFRRHYGMTIGEFIRHRRIEFALEKLRTTDWPIVEIALEAGFAHQAHFTTVFHRLTGMTPRQYCAEMGVPRRVRASDLLPAPSAQ